MKKNVFLLTVLFVAQFTLQATQLEKSWSAETGKKIKWNKLSPDGNIICGTNAGKTVAIDQETGKLVWENSFDHGPFQVLPNTTYIYWFSDPKGLFILDPISGKPVCDTKKMGISEIQSFYPVRTGNSILIYSKMNNLEQVTMVSLNNGDKLWSKEFNFNKKFGKKTKFVDLSVEIEEHPDKMKLHCAPFGDGKGGVFISFHERIMNIDAKGSVVWDIEYPSQFGKQDGFFKASSVDFKNIIPDNAGKFLYVLSGSYMSCHKRVDGSLAWENPVKVYAPVKNIIFEKEQMTLVPTPNTMTQKAYINCVDYKTGTKHFGDKELKVKGGYEQFSFCSKGIVLITKSYTSGAHYFNIIDQEKGKFELAKPLKLFEGPYHISEVKGGILITSQKGAQLYNYSKKDFVIDKKLKVSGDDILIRKDIKNLVYLYSSTKNNIYTLNKENLEIKQFNQAKINVKGGDTPKGFTAYKDGLVMFSDQNVVKFDWNGNLIFEKYYKAPKASGWKIAGASLKAIGGLAKMAASAATAVATTELHARVDAGLNDAQRGLDQADREVAKGLQQGQEIVKQASKDAVQGNQNLKREIQQAKGENAELNSGLNNMEQARKGLDEISEDDLNTAGNALIDEANADYQDLSNSMHAAVDATQAEMENQKNEICNNMSECATLGFTSSLEAAAEIGRLSKRFKNSKSTKDNVVMMINNKDEGGIGLAVVSKKDGEVKLFIPMKQSREGTTYDIDPITNRLFWIPTLNGSKKSKKYANITEMEKKGTIVMYDMNKL